MLRAFPVPQDRKYNNSIFFKPDLTIKEWVAEPDFYIVHRVGVVMRVWSFVLASCAFIVAYIHSYHGFMPELFIFYDKPIFIDVFNGFINIVGRVMAVLLLYYFVLFFKHVSFKEYNFLRYGHKTLKGKGFKLNLYAVMCPFIFLVCMVYIGKSFQYLSLQSHSLDLYNNVPFVFCLYVFSVFALGICAQGFFAFSLMLFYAVFERLSCLRGQ